MKRIVYFVDYPLDLLGGAQLSTQSICDELIKDDRFEPVVVTPTLMQQDSRFDYKIIEYNVKNSNLLFGAIARIRLYRGIIKEEKPDFIHAQMPLSAIVLGVMKIIGMCKNIDFVFTDRALYSGYSKKNQILFKCIAKKMKYVICTTNINAKEWAAILPDRKIKVIYNSVSPAFLKGVDKFHDEEHDARRISLGFAGRVTDFKDWPLSITICKALQQRKLKFQVNCVMSAYSEAEKEQMQQYICMFKKIVGDSNFHVWIDLGQIEMAEFYKKTDIFVLTSKFESFGKTAIEAMCCNCAVVATNVGGLPEVVGKESNLYNSSEYDKCVDLIEEYILNKEKLREDKNWFYERYFELFDISRNITEHKKMYLEH